MIEGMGDGGHPDPALQDLLSVVAEQNGVEASPEEVEEGICQKIEEAVRSIDGIKKMTSVAKEGSGSVVLERQRRCPCGRTSRR